MFADRRKKLVKLLSQMDDKDNNSVKNDIENYDAVLIDSPENLYYYTGFTGGEAVFLMYIDHEKEFSIEDMFLITDSRYYEQVERECPDIPLVRLNNRTYTEVIYDLLYGKEVNYESKTLTSVKQDRPADMCKCGCIAIEESMNLSRYLKLKETLTDCRLILAGDIINRPRMIKDANELELLRKAENIGDEAFSHVLSIIKPGMKESDIAIELEFYMKKQGASKLSFDTIVASGPNSSMPHAQVTDRIIKNGDFVTMDFGCIYKGYCSDMTRTIAVGKPSEEMRKVYQIVLDANLRALDGIREGVKCCDIDALARGYIKDKGYGDYFGHGLGHSVGLYIHEEPRFSPKCDVITKCGMVITDEPGIYLPGKFGVRIEDLVMVTETGYECFSHSPKELLVL